MIRKLIATDNDTATTVLRLVLGVVFFRWFALEQKGWDALAFHGVERELRASLGRPEERSPSGGVPQR